MTTCLLITTFNRSGLLAKSLERLAGWTQPDEILVVDDGGGDGCQDVCAAFGVRYLYTHNPSDSSCCHARNVGIRNTDADIVITSEPELIFETDLVAQMLALHEANPDDVISAGTVHHCQEDGSTQTIKGWVAPFAALYERQWLLDIGGWDEGYNRWGWEDTDVLTRLRWNGHGQVIATEIEVTHQWHPSRAVSQDANEARFRAKEYPRDLVANTGEWGHAIPR